MSSTNNYDGADPTVLWEKLSVKRQCSSVDLDVPVEQPADKIRVVTISDTHSSHAKMARLPPGDILIHAGDFSRTGTEKEVTDFYAWISQQPHQHKIVIAGNHDLTFDKQTYDETSKRFGHRTPFDCDKIRRQFVESDDVIYLEDTGTIVEGYTFWGSPWQPVFCDWAFNLERGEDLRKVWSKIPTDTDILITHGPPLGYGDVTSSGERAGCYDLLTAIEERIRPLYHISGHIHEGYGVTTDGKTRYINASTCTLRYRPTNPPIVFDLPRKS
eukprot:GFYU01001153.1.p1 GENE.GFYU01001153.1~~GFYU01001153.1.p1  ORF type:complete len:288 (-),score=8.49 GFYU01001153.1:384-1199(-)